MHVHTCEQPPSPSSSIKMSQKDKKKNGCLFSIQHTQYKTTFVKRTNSNSVSVHVHNVKLVWVCQNDPVLTGL